MVSSKLMYKPMLFNFSTSSEIQFNYSKMDYYQLLEVSPFAESKDLKSAYLKQAKKYHPDIYKGANQDHFK